MVKKATPISRFVSAVEDRSVYVGLGIHKNTCSVALFGPEDGVIETHICSAGEEALAEPRARLGCRIAHVACESKPTKLALSRALKRAGFAFSAMAVSD